MASPRPNPSLLDTILGRGSYGSRPVSLETVEAEERRLQRERAESESEAASQWETLRRNADPGNPAGLTYGLLKAFQNTGYSGGSGGGWGRGMAAKNIGKSIGYLDAERRAAREASLHPLVRPSGLKPEQRVSVHGLGSLDSHPELQEAAMRALLPSGLRETLLSGGQEDPEPYPGYSLGFNPMARHGRP